VNALGETVVGTYDKDNHDVTCHQFVKGFEGCFSGTVAAVFKNDVLI